MTASVIIPYLPNERFRETMEAQLAAQTFRDFEAIFVEDTERRGPSWARNRGLERAQGDIILFADVDDEIAPDWIARMVEGIGDADLGWVGIESRRVVSPKAYLWPRVFGYRLRDLASALLPGGLWTRCRREMSGVWKLALRRSRLGDIRFDESLRLYEDAMYIAALSERAESLSVFTDAGYRWIVRESGTMTRGFSSANIIANKFAVRDARFRLDPNLRYWRGTFLLSFLEILRKGGLRAALRYAAWLPMSPNT